MKSIVMILVLVSIVSCGKNDKTKASTPNDTRQDEQEREPKPHLDDYLDASSIGEVELLNVTAKMATSLLGDKIIFNAPLTVQDVGSKITCSFTVRSGEVWHYRKVGSEMELDLPDGSKQILKSVDNNEDFYGPWSWKEIKDGIKLRRRYTFLPNTIIVNQDCEK